MLRSTSLFAVMMVAASISAQQPAVRPQTDSPQSPAVAQDAPPNQVPGTRDHRQPVRREGRGESHGRFDSLVADRLILGNQEEVALLKFGMERTKNNDVKELAQSMIKDHEKAISDLRRFASPEHAKIELTADQNTNKNVVTREARKLPGGVEDASYEDLLTRMHRMARRSHEQCLILNREELTKYEGHDFDQAFLGQQLGAHIGMLGKLKAAQEETSADLSDLTAQMQETTKKHREHLEKLMDDLGKEAHGKK